MSSSKKEKFYGVNDELWGHKWGFRDSSVSYTHLRAHET